MAHEWIVPLTLLVLIAHFLLDKCGFDMGYISKIILEERVNSQNISMR